MTITGIRPYGLAGNWCEECGTAKWNRLMLAGYRTGCTACDKVTLRHRCMSRPDISELADGQSWECSGCGSKWEPETVTEACGECCAVSTHMVQVRRWVVTEGDRMDSAPPYAAGWPFGITPWRPARMRVPPAETKCHVTATGISVHVKPECRCRR